MIPASSSNRCCRGLVEYGLIPEFIGRLPVVAALHQLDQTDLVRILHPEPKHALVRQFQRFFEFDDIELVFADDSLEAIADKALARETGARGLRSIIGRPARRPVRTALPRGREQVRGDPRIDREGPVADAGDRTEPGRGPARRGPVRRRQTA